MIVKDRAYSSYGCAKKYIHKLTTRLRHCKQPLEGKERGKKVTIRLIVRMGRGWTWLWIVPDCELL